MQDNRKDNNIRIIGIPEGEEEQDIENLFERVMMENFPNMMRENVTQIQEIQRVPNKRNPKRPTKVAKFQEKEKILKATKGEIGSNIQGSPGNVSS